VERIISYIDGTRETVVSVPVTSDNRLENGQTAAVAAMITRLDTVFSPVLPVHTSFAIIDNGSGEVLFHANDERSLVENFIDEADGDQDLIAKIAAAQSGFLDISYRGIDVRAYVAPIPDVPWTLVTFKALDLDEELLFRSLMSAVSMLVVLFALAIGFAVISGYLTRLVTGKKADPFAWLWANPVNTGAMLAGAFFVMAQMTFAVTALLLENITDVDALLICFFTPAHMLLLLQTLIHTSTRSRVLQAVLAALLFLIMFNVCHDWEVVLA
jgi:hypothetical protein